MKRSFQRGFTLIELAVALALSAGLVIAAITFVGRRVVDNIDAVRAAASYKLIDAKVVERHQWRPTRHGCASDHVDSFVVEGKNEAGETKRVIVCCRAWFAGCDAR